MKQPSNLPPGVTDNMIPGNRPEDEEFERWIEDNWECLFDEFLSTHPDIHKDNYDESGEWDEFLNKKFEEEVL